MSEEISSLQKKIINLILEDSSRAGAITRMLSKKGFDCQQNEVIQALNDLEKRGLVERSSEKSWSATGKAEDYPE